MKNKIILFVCLLFIIIKETDAQIDSLFWNSEIARIATATSNPNWINIRPDVNINPQSFLKDYKQALRLSDNDDMQPSKTETDNIGFTHYKYQQFYKGYKVFFGEFMLHAKAGRLQTANGKMVIGLNKNPIVNTSKTAALQNALQFLPAPKYAWEISQLESNYKLIMHDSNATYKPVGEMVWIHNKNADIKDISKYELAYMFDIYTAAMDGKKIFISAASGAVINSFPIVYNCSGTSVTTNFNGSQSFSTRLIPGSAPLRHNIWNDCQTAFVRTQQWAASGPYADYISNAGNNWTGASSAASSHWAMERTMDYYLNVHTRNSWNNSSGGVFILQNALFSCPTMSDPNAKCGQNASFGGGTMLVGNADNASTIDDYNSLDIVAHEFTHGVTSSSFANLNYSKESGALNESFSDILGVSCYAWFNGLNADKWKVGFDRKDPANTSVSLYIRNMANPKDRGQPDTYKAEPEWYNTDSSNAGNDNWGVHTNSGVQNYMYYLLTSGGSGTNDNGTTYSLIGIGIVAARDIAYRALTAGYLFSTSDHAQARTAWVHAAVDLYGECSLQAIETGKAWDAVGLPPPLNNTSSLICGTYGGSIYTVTKSGIYTLAAAPNCVMTVTPANLVQFGARKVVLSPGFRAQNGSKFRAYVSDCRYAAY